MFLEEFQQGLKKEKTMDWADVKLYVYLPEVWAIEWMASDANRSSLYQNNNGAESIIYILPIIDKLGEYIKVAGPNYEKFKLFGKKINRFGYHDLGYAWLPLSKVQINHTTVPCQDCGWICLQQCFKFGNIKRPYENN